MPSILNLKDAQILIESSCFIAVKCSSSMQIWHTLQSPTVGHQMDVLGESYGLYEVLGWVLEPNNQSCLKIRKSTTNSQEASCNPFSLTSRPKIEQLWKIPASILQHIDEQSA